MKHIKKFNENSLLDPMDNWKDSEEEFKEFDDESSENFDNIKNSIQSSFSRTLKASEFELDEYTTNVSSKLDIKSSVSTERGKYEYELIIKRIS